MNESEDGVSSVTPELDFSAMGAEFLRCPHAHYQSALQRSPVMLDPQTGMYWVMGHELIREVARNTEVFSSRIDVVGDVYKDGLDSEVAEIRSQSVPRVATLLTQDPPVHTTYRELVKRLFAADKVAAIKPYMEQLAQDLIDDFPTNGEIEFVQKFAAPLPICVIADQLGVPRDQADNVKDWSDAIVDLLGQVGDREHQVDCAKRERAAMTYLLEEVERCRREPNDKIISLLCSLTYTPVEGEPRLLDAGELLSILTQLMVAGNETSTNTIAGGMWYLAQDPELVTKIRDGGRKACINFVEELLRVWSPNQGQFRRTTTDTELAGVPIPKGAMVHLRYGGANADPAVFEAPEKIDIDRRNARKHMTFGVGTHFCVGAPLARQEILTGFEVLLDRFESFELLEDPEDMAVHPHYNLRGLQRLAIRVS